MGGNCKRSMRLSKSWGKRIQRVYGGTIRVAWKEVLAASDEEAKERYMEAYREVKRNFERCTYQSKKKVNEQSGRKMNEDVNGNRKWFLEGE